MKRLRAVTNSSGETLLINPDNIMVVTKSHSEGCLKIYFTEDYCWTIKGTLIDFQTYINEDHYA